MLQLVLPKGSLERATLELFEGADLAVTRAKIHEEVSQVLTPDQQTKAKALLQKARTMAQRHANHMFSHITGDPLQAH